MEKSNRKLLLSIVAFAAVLCLAFSFFQLSDGNAVEDSAVAQENTLSITEVKQTFLHGYNSVDDLGYRSEYNVIFDKDIFDDTTQQGAIVASTHGIINVSDEKADMKTLLSTMKINGTVLGNISGGAAITKIANNAIKIYTGRPYGYAEFEIPAGTELGGKTITDAVNLYENQDWTFSMTAPTEFKVFTIIERPVGSGAYLWLNVWFNQKLPNFDNAEVAAKAITLTANGQNVDCYYGYGNDWDTGTMGYNFHFNVKNESFDGQAPFVLTFPKDWNYSGDAGYALQTEQLFMIGDVEHTWDNLVKYEELFAHDVTYKQGSTTLGTMSTKVLTLAQPTTFEDYVSGKLFIGYTDGKNLYKAGELIIPTQSATYSVVELGVETVGAELKIWGSTSGIRFVTQIGKSDWDGIDGGFLGEYGTLIARAQDLGENELTVEKSAEDAKIKKIVSTTCRVTDDLIEVRGGVENLAALNYSKNIVSRAYIAINYSSGVEYVYTQAIERNMAEIANYLLDNQTENQFGEAELVWLNAYAGK